MDKSALNPNGDDPPLGSLIEYFMQNIDPTSNLPQEPWRFNSVNQWGGYSNIAIFKGDDPWQFNTDQSLNIRPDLLALKLSPGDIMTALLEPVRKQLRADIANNTNSGWNTLMGFDGMTMTQFLSSPWPDSLDKPILPPPLIGFVPLPPYNYDTIQWFETFNGRVTSQGTNWYDQAFSEIVLESLDFDFPPPGTKPDITWYCILGGAQQLATKLEATVNQLSGNPNKVQYSSQVTALTQVDAMSVNVDINGGAGNGGTTNPYNCVFNTTTLGCLEHMDTTSTSLNSATRSAMRSLGYGPSCKVAIKFTHAWWIYDLPPENAIKRGGLGHSDLNIRTCVYPSYNIYDKNTTTAVLLCTYTWQQDAERLGSLMGGDETQLKTLLIADLVRLHSGGSMTPDQLFATINGSYISHFAWDWYKAPNAAGAFAFFRPFQFSEMWGKMIIPAGDVVVMGEHASPHHAWVVGALESAVHGLAAWCSMTKTNNAKYAGAMQDVLNVLMPENPDPTNPYVGLPLYMDINTAQWHGLLAGFARQEMLEGRAEGVNRLSLEETAEAKRKRAAAYLKKLGVRG
ncbi:amine oxidase [Coniochaeta sp. PMI_546]|nr:amine oxidase [Coniochaeta sp. PMI_546]